MYAMLIEIQTIEGGQKDVSSQVGTKLKKTVCGGGDTFMPWWEQSPLNEKVQKKTKNTPMETTKEIQRGRERERERKK